MRSPFPGMDPYLERHWPDVHLALLDRAYRTGRYDAIDYSKPCVPPLEAEELAWAQQLLREWPRE